MNLYWDYLEAAYVAVVGKENTAGPDDLLDMINTEIKCMNIWIWF